MEIDRTKLPEEIAVFVTAITGGSHQVIETVDDGYYLVHQDETSLPEISSICILIPTYERPLWYREGQDDRGNGMFDFRQQPNTLTTWKIKRNESN